MPVAASCLASGFGACCATVANGSATVNFDHALPAGIGVGDVLTFDGVGPPVGPVENFRILSVNGPRTSATVETAAGVAHTLQDYRITSPFKTGNVSPSLAEQHVMIGNGDQQQNVNWSSEFEGDIDEVRISRAARSDNWIATEYANQSSPSTFYRVGDEELVP